MTAWEKKKLTDPVINKATLWIVTVDKDKFGLAWEQGEPLILGPGVHIRNSSFFAFDKFVNQNTNVISHGPYHRIIVEQGHRAISWLGDKPLLLLPGVHTINSSIFRYDSSAPNDKQVVNLAPYTVVTVRDGEVGVGYRRGVLSVLEPGEHWLNSQVNEVFVDFLPTTKQVMLLKPLDVLTSDGLILRVRGSICFHISNPIKTLKTVGNQILYGLDDKKGSTKPQKDYLDTQQNISSKLFGTIMLRADTTFASILTGSEALSSMALGMAKTAMDHDPEPHKVSAAGGKGKELEKHKGAGMSSVEFSRQELTHLLSRQFKHSLAKEFHSEWGVNLDDMVILEVDIMDKDVRAALATGIKSNIEANTNRRNAEAKAETERILAAGTRDGVRIRAEGEAAHIKMIAKAEAEAGEMLQASPASFQIRMAETSVKAFTKGSLIIAPDGGTQSLLGLIGAAQQVSK
jgi:regulator of protease activity HflC (stomatin/prohibitin superfamily)